VVKRADIRSGGEGGSGSNRRRGAKSAGSKQDQDTLVVHAVNQVLRWPCIPHDLCRSHPFTIAWGRLPKAKLKGIDGVALPAGACGDSDATRRTLPRLDMQEIFRWEVR